VHAASAALGDALEYRDSVTHVECVAVDQSFLVGPQPVGDDSLLGFSTEVIQVETRADVCSGKHLIQASFSAPTGRNRRAIDEHRVDALREATGLIALEPA
jgi:hypothetical protein